METYTLVIFRSTCLRVIVRADDVDRAEEARCSVDWIGHALSDFLDPERPMNLPLEEPLD